jgi:hypothetical protein
MTQRAKPEAHHTAHSIQNNLARQLNVSQELWSQTTKKKTMEAEFAP